MSKIDTYNGKVIGKTRCVSGQQMRNPSSIHVIHQCQFPDIRGEQDPRVTLWSPCGPKASDKKKEKKNRKQRWKRRKVACLFTLIQASTCIYLFGFRPSAFPEPSPVSETLTHSPSPNITSLATSHIFAGLNIISTVKNRLHSAGS